VIAAQSYVLKKKPLLGDEITASWRGGSGKSARSEQATGTMEMIFKKHGAGLFADGSRCKCCSNVVV
jgi:hypothetical protein